jgi:HSP20 family molecular chaperone IbpA
MKAKVTITVEAKTQEDIDEIMELKKEIESGKFQRDAKENGVICKATFEFIER